MVRMLSFCGGRQGKGLGPATEFPEELVWYKQS